MRHLGTLALLAALAPACSHLDTRLDAPHGSRSAQAPRTRADQLPAFQAAPPPPPVDHTDTLLQVSAGAAIALGVFLYVD